MPQHGMKQSIVPLIFAVYHYCENGNNRNGIIYHIIATLCRPYVLKCKDNTNRRQCERKTDEMIFISVDSKSKGLHIAYVLFLCALFVGAGVAL